MTGATETAGDVTVEVEELPGSMAQLRIEVPAADVDRAIDAALRRLGSKMRIPGFRPGKAPAPIVERTVGWEAVRDDAVEDLVTRAYFQAVDKESVEPVSDPTFDVDTSKLERGAPMSFSAKVTIRPSVDLGDYLMLRVGEPTTDIAESDVDETLAEVRRRHSTLEDVDRAAQVGDVVHGKLVMRRGDEVLSGEDGGERDLDLDPGKLLPGLAEALVGLSAGDERTFTLTLPEDFTREDLRGVEVTVDCAVSQVRERKLPPLDDSLATLDGNGSSLDQLRDHYRNALVDAAQKRDEEKFEGDVLEAFRDLVKVDVPEVMVDREIDRSLRELEMRFTGMGLSWEQYLQFSGETVEKLRGERREMAAHRVKLELAMDALAEAEGLEVDESAVEREEKRVAEGRKLSAAQRSRLHEVAHTDLRRQAAGQRLLEIARGDE